MSHLTTPSPNLAFGRRFTALVGTVNFGQDPAVSGPPTNRKHISFGFQNIKSGEKFVVGTVDDLGPRAPKTASFRVADNTFGSFSVIQLGNKILRYGIDWIAGASTILTSANIVAAINNLGGPWSASNGGTNVVSIEFSDSMWEVYFSPKNFSTVANFDQITPETNEMAEGSPTIVAPIIQ